MNNTDATQGFFALCILMFAFAPVPPDELSECRRLAPKYEAEVEVRLWDDTRVDLLSERYAIEVDWAPKWAESIGQALYYAELTRKQPAILLLIKDDANERHFVYRAQTVCAKYGIRVFVERVPAVQGAGKESR
jgi:hypothetical protein